MLHLATTARALRTKTPQLARAFSITPLRMGEGDTGGVRSGGSAASDSFSRREEASENLYVKQREQEKLKQLKAELQKSQEEVESRKKAIEEIEKKK